jgi:hypothetical protein
VFLFDVPAEILRHGKIYKCRWEIYILVIHSYNKFEVHCYKRELSYLILNYRHGCSLLEL